MQSRKVAFVVFLLALFALAITARATEEDSKSKAVTFNKDVLPILQKNCQSCHRPGEIAPMSFLSYSDARPWAKAMKQAVVTRQMPPWFADPAYGHFENDKRLSESEIKTISARFFTVSTIRRSGACRSVAVPPAGCSRRSIR